MRNKKLSADFYRDECESVAQKLIGKILCVKIADGTVIRKRILETEAYLGFNDSASHASKGKTKRNSVMFEEGGIVYIYLIYGIHYMLNIVTGEKDFPQAVLIRRVEDSKGPGLVCKNLQIDRTFNGTSLIEDKIWIEEDQSSFKFIRDKRINIQYATPFDQERLLRFILLSNEQ